MKLRWLELERDMSPWLLVWSLIGWGIGIAVYLSEGWVLGVISFFLATGLACLIQEFIGSIRIPTEARCFSNEAVSAFEKAYPDAQITSVALRAIEEERYIFSVRYQSPRQISKPEARLYFAVSRSNNHDVTELDIAEWWPRGLK